MTKLLATSVVRGSNQGDSHGGVYLVDIHHQAVDLKLDWRKQDIDWRGAGADRGLRGIAIEGDTIYIASSDELFAYTMEFDLIESWRNPFLKHCHEITKWDIANNRQIASINVTMDIRSVIHCLAVWPN